MRRYLNEAVLFGLTMILFFGSHLLASSLEDRSIWWTPVRLAPSALEAADRATILLDGRELQEVLRAGDLQLLSRDGPPRKVTGDAVRVRFDNWDRHVAEGLSYRLLGAFGLGVGACSLAMGIWKATHPSGGDAAGQ